MLRYEESVYRPPRSGRCIFRGNHASNHLPLRGTRAAGRERLLAGIDRALERPDACLRDEWIRGL